MAIEFYRKEDQSHIYTVALSFSVLKYSERR
jgi:hypothetical protein